MGFVAGFARAVARVFYRLERTGPALPEGPVLLVANHTNALLDPAIVWATAGRRIRFIAKSTLFSGSAVSPLVRNAGAIPVYRPADPGADPARNVETFAAVGRALAEGATVCIFPEGVSHSEARLQPLRTGAARIALAATAEGVRLAIVPVGLDFDRKTIFRARAVAAYGEAFGCEDLVAQYRTDPRAAVGALTARIAERLRALVVEADPRTDAEVVERIDALYSAARGLGEDPEDRLDRRRTIAEGLARLRAEEPEWYASIRDTIRAYDERLSRFGLRDQDVGAKPGLGAVSRFAVREGVLAAFLVPIVVVGTLVFWLPYRLTGPLARSQSPDFDVEATVKALGGVVTHVGWWIALTAAAWIWKGALAGATVFAAAPLLALATLYSLEREAAVLDTVRAWLAARSAPESERRRLAAERDAIAQVLDRVREWLG